VFQRTLVACADVMLTTFPTRLQNTINKSPRA
jgi:hypothetical protein